MANPLDPLYNTSVAPGEELGAEGFIPAGALKAAPIQSAAKAAAVSEKAQQKVGQLTASALIQQRREALERDVLRGVEQMSARNALLADMRYGQLRENTANRQREAGEIAGDTYVSLEGGTVNLTAGIPMSVLDVATQEPTGVPVTLPDLINRGIRHGLNIADRAGLPVGTHQDMRDQLLAPSQQLLGEYNTARQKRMSAVSQADMEIFSEENQKAAAASKAKADQEIKDGDSAFWANTRRVGRDALHDGGNLVSRPTTFANVLTEQVPSLATGFVAKAGTSAAAVQASAQRARGNLLEEAMEASGDAAKRARFEARKIPKTSFEDAAAAQIARRNLAVTVGATEGGAAYGESAGQVWETPLAQLLEDNPDAQEAYREALSAFMRQEMDPVDAAKAAEDFIKGELASQQGLTRAGIVAPLAGAVSSVGAGFQLNQLGRRGASEAAEAGSREAVEASIRRGMRPSGSSRLVGDIVDVGGEIAEEGLQGGISALAQNAAEYYSGNRNVDWAEGVGSEIGIGMVAAGGLSGGMRSPSMAANTALDSVDMAKEAFGETLQIVDKLGEGTRKAQDDLQKAAVSDIGEGIKKATDTAREAATKAGVTVAPMAEADPVMAPEVQEALNTAGEAPPTDTWDALGRLLTFRQADNLPDPVRANVDLMTLKYVRALEREAEASGNEDFKAAAAEVMGREDIAELIESFKSEDPEATAALLKTIADSPLTDEIAEVDPKMAQAMEGIIQRAAVAPTTMKAADLKVARTAAASMALPEADQKILEVAIEQAEIQEELEAAQTRTGTYTPNKQSQVVAEEVRGSLRDHVNSIAEAMSVGAIQRAMPAYRKLLKFGQGAQTRAQAFDLAAAEHVALGTPADQDVKVAVGGTIGPDGTLDRSKPFSFNAGNEGALWTLDSVFADTRAIARAANSMLRHYPELARELDLSPEEARLDENLAPGYQNVPKAQADAYARDLRNRLFGNNPAPAAPAKPAKPAPAPKPAPTAKVTPEPVPAPEPADTGRSKISQELLARAEKADVEELTQMVSDIEERIRSSQGTEESVDRMRDDRADMLEILEQKKQAKTESPEPKVSRLRQLVDEGKARLSKGIYYLSQAAQSKYMGGTTRDGEVYVNLAKIREDGLLKYMTNSEQKAAMLESMGVTAEEFVSLFPAQDDPTYVRSVANFIGRHEQSHAKNEDRKTYPKKEDGSLDLMHPDAIDIEIRATMDALTEAQTEKLDSLIMDSLLVDQLNRNSATTESDQAGTDDQVQTSEEATVEIKVNHLGLIERLGNSINKFSETYKLRKKATGLFSRPGTGASPLTTALQMVQDGRLAELLPEDKAYLAKDLTDKQKAGLEFFLKDGVKLLSEQLNKTLNSAANGRTTSMIDGRAIPGKGWLNSLMNPKTEGAGNLQAWDFINMRQLHLIQVNEDGTVQYQPHVMEAVTAAALRWAASALEMNPRFDYKDVSETFFDNKGVPADFLPLFQGKHHFVNPTRQLAGDIARTLGLQGKDDAPISYVDGMMKALAADALHALVRTGVVEHEAKALTDVKDSPVLHFVRFTGTEQFKKGHPNFGNARALRVASEYLGTMDLVTNILFPENQDQVFVGEPSKVVPTRTTGTGMPLVKHMRTALENRNQTRFNYNAPVGRYIDAVGVNMIMEWLGHDPNATEENTVKSHWPSVRGKNLGLEADAKRAKGLLNQMKQYQKANGIKSLSEVPLYFSWRAISNTRAMMNGMGPQASKFLRELFTPNQVTIKTDDETSMMGLYLMLGQALGVKTEYNVPEKVMDIVKTMLETDMADGENAAIRKASQLIQEQLKNPSKAKEHNTELAQALKDANVSTMRGLHALITHARLKQNEGTDFTHGLALELDGKTDGPVNALVHFGLTRFTEKHLKQLRQGGIIINAKDGNETLSQLGRQIGDAYSNTTDAANVRVRQRMEQATPAMQVLFRNAARAFLLTGNATMKDGDELTPENFMDQFTFARDVVKPGTMTSIYGSGTPAMLWEMVHGIVAKAAAAMDGAFKDGVPMDEEMIHVLRALMESAYDAQGKPTGIRQDLSGLADPDTYKEFFFTKNMLENMHANLTATLGSVIADSVQSEQADTLRTFGKMYALTALQHVQHEKLFNDEVEALYVQKEKHNKHARYDGLSKAEEKAILEKIAKYAPIYEIQNGQQVSLASKDNSGTLEVKGKKQRVAAIGGGFRMDINQTKLAHPRVKFASQLTIALGDASMMATVYQKLRQALDVFDGWEVSNDTLFGDALDVNKAVWDNYQFDPISSVLKQFENFDLDLNTLDRETLNNLAWSMEIESARDYERTDLIAMMNDAISVLRTSLENDAKRIALTKEAIGTLRTTVDHMASANVPHVVNPEGITLESDAEVVAYINAYVAERMLKQEVTDAVENESSAQTGAQIRGKEYVGALIKKHEFKNPLHKFVLSSIIRLLPENLKIVDGSVDEIEAYRLQHYPDVTIPEGAYNGLTMSDGTVLMNNRKSDLLVHELIHAATRGMVRNFYENGGKGLSTTQKIAIKNFEKLADQFVAMDPKGSLRMAQVQDIVAQFKARGNMADSINEFMAYTLTEANLSARLQGEAAVSGIRKLGQQILSNIRKLLGLPNNKQIENMLEQTVASFEFLVRNADPMTVDADSAMASLASTETPAEAERLLALSTSLNRLMLPLNKNAEGPVPTSVGVNEALANRAKLAARAERIRETFLDAGFELTPLAEAVFDKLQVVFASGLALDSNVMSQFQEIYLNAIDKITPSTFLSDPTTTDNGEHAKAQRMFEALTNPHAEDGKRTALLANFIALSLTYPPMRELLADIQPKRKDIKEGDLNDRLRAGMTNLLNMVSEVTTHSRKPNQLAAIEALVFELEVQQDKLHKRLSRMGISAIDQAGVKSREALEKSGKWAEAKIQARKNKGLDSTLDSYINGALKVFSAITDERRGGAMQETIQSMANTMDLPGPLADLISDILGTSDSNEAIHLILSRGKHMVSRVRQRLRDETPKTVRSWFSRQLTKDEWKTMTLLGRADVQSLLGKVSAKRMIELLKDDAALKAELKTYESKFLSSKHGSHWIESAHNLAKSMLHGGNEATDLFYKNAYAMVRLAGTSANVDDATIQKYEADLDRYTTLASIQHMSTNERAVLADLFETEAEGMQKTLASLAYLNRIEKDKPHATKQKLNQWKGDLPRSLDPRSHVMLAHKSDTKKLAKKGYEMIAPYEGDSSDKFGSEYAYFASNLKIMGMTFATAGEAGYAQGALQTVEATVSGADSLLGTSLREDVSTTIRSPKGVGMILSDKLDGNGHGNNNLIPIFDEDMEVVMFERPLHRDILDAHLRGKEDLAMSMGIWFGRQAEEAIARKMNTEVVAALKANYDQGKKEKKEGEYVNIAAPRTDPVSKEVWDAIPREIQLELLDAFKTGDKNQKPEVWVRKDMRRNALGYRAASVADVFTGKTQLPEDVRRTLENAAYAVLGKRAYQILTVSERSWQGAVGTAKDWIVVRSGTVALANAASNQFQLLTHDIPAKELAPRQLEKFLQAETYFRNERRLAEIAVEIEAAPTPNLRAKLAREQAVLQDTNNSLSIKPLIDAGQLPTITEGLAENDEYTYTADFTEWLENHAKKLPSGLMTAAKFAVISKDTALYQGMNRFIQLSDFVARAVLYDKYIAEGMTSKQALAKTDERFVNYNLLGGRSRDYLESMGLLWFTNYKIRIQKVAVQAIRENPLKFLMGGIGAEIVDVDSLYSSSALETNYGYSIGTDQFWRASEMNMWREATGL